MKAVYIDTRSRNFRSYAVSVTQVEDYQLVIRHAVELPEIPGYADLYIVDATGYHAAASNGFVSVTCTESPFYNIVGELTLDNGLRPVAPRAAYVVSKGYFNVMPTHDNSNCATAEAGCAVLKDLYTRSSLGLLILEGQSDAFSACSIKGELEIEEEIPAEHRTDIINCLSIDVAKAMEEYYLSLRLQQMYTQDKHDLLLVMAAAVLLGVSDAKFKKDGLAVSVEVAGEIVKKVLRYGANLDDNRHARFYFSDEEIDQMKEIIKGTSLAA